MAQRAYNLRSYPVPQRRARAGPVVRPQPMGVNLGGVPKSVGSNGETVFAPKGERAFEVDVWTFNRRCREL